MQEKEAMFYRKLDKGVVQCQLCPHFCVLKLGEYGKCKARQNQNGKLVSVVYGKPCSIAIDPIEKKPLYHFLPGEAAFSIATTGCNLACKHCQNAEISQAYVDDVPHMNMTPEQVVLDAKLNNAKIIAYTYTEPTIFYEYMLDIAKIAKKENIKNIIVSNGFINKEPLKELCKYIDGANIDLKSLSPEFYEEICHARLAPILETLKLLKQQGVWVEVTNLLIPTLNDSDEQISKLIEWVKENLGHDVPLHFTAFYPYYKLNHLPPTSIATLKKARKMALDHGFHYVYTGNIPDEEGSTTYCPRCGKPIIKRIGFEIIENNLIEGRCPCGEEIAGMWS